MSGSPVVGTALGVLLGKTCTSAKPCFVRVIETILEVSAEPNDDEEAPLRFGREATKPQVAIAPATETSTIGRACLCKFFEFMFLFYFQVNPDSSELISTLVPSPTAPTKK
jgi:hypothetical protein